MSVFFFKFRFQTMNTSSTFCIWISLFLLDFSNLTTFFVQDSHMVRISRYNINRHTYEHALWILLLFYHMIRIFVFFFFPMHAHRPSSIPLDCCFFFYSHTTKNWSILFHFYSTPIPTNKTASIGERPYACDICNKTFAVKSYVTAHRWVAIFTRFSHFDFSKQTHIDTKRVNFSIIKHTFWCLICTQMVACVWKTIKLWSLFHDIHEQSSVCRSHSHTFSGSKLWV